MAQMPIIIDEGGQKREYEKAPAGLHKGVLCDVIDLGMVENKAYGKTQHKVLLVFQINKRMELSDYDKKEGRTEGRPYTCSKRFTATLNEKGNLRPFIESWINRKLTADEVKGFDIESLIGKGARLQVMHDTADDGKVYANIANCMALDEDEVAPKIVDYVRKVDRDAEKAAKEGAEGAANDEDDHIDESLGQARKRLKIILDKCAQYGIPTKELPDSVLNSAERVNKICDTIQVRITQVEDEMRAKAAEQAKKVADAVALEDEDADFDPFSVPEGETEPVADEVVAEEPKATVIGADVVAKETEGLPEHVVAVAQAFADFGTDIAGFNKNEKILKATNEFRATSNKKPIAAMSELTAAAANIVVKNIADGTIKVS